MASEEFLSDSPDDSGSDYEATIKPTKRRQKPVSTAQPPKRPRRKAAVRVSTPPDSSLQQTPSQGTSRQASSRPGMVVNGGNQGITAKDFYDAVFSGDTVLTVNTWLDSYKQSRESGLLVLINFIVRCCGCKGVVSRQMLDSMQNADIINTLTKTFSEDSAHYPLSASGFQLRHFKAELCEFVRVLVNSCRNSLIYDEYLFPSLMALLTGLSDSQVRAFRHTSTLIAMKLMTGFVEVAVLGSVQLQTTQRQYDTENSKGPHDQDPSRLETLRAAIKEMQENRSELSSLMTAAFRGVFVHRYRDWLLEIRAVCIEELGMWLQKDPEDFLNDRCLKYLGWTLYDKQSVVRLQSVRVLQGLYQEKEFIGRLELFTSRFKERMLRMVLDKEPEVGVEVVKLLLLIQEMTEEGLGEEDCHHIYPLVYASHGGLASAAGIFLYNKLKNTIRSNQENDKSENAAFFQILISFYIQSEFHEHGAYLVDSLWGVAKAELRDWETMTALLQDAGLLYVEEGVLIDLMICAVRQAAQATPPVGRTQGKKLLSMKDKKVQKQDRRRLTAHFIPLLPQLLVKYSADAEKVSLLLSAPLYFDLEMYNSSPVLGKHLDQLLSQICGIMGKHSEDTVMEACAKLVSTLCNSSFTFSTRANLAFSQLMDDFTECFSVNIDDLVKGTADDADVYVAAIALKRIAALSSAKDPTGWQLLGSCLQLLRSKLESREYNKELMVSALKCAGWYVMWAQVNAVNSPPAEKELKRLKKELGSFCQVCEKCLSLNEAEIRNQAFELLCDILLLYSTNSAHSEPSLHALVHPPSDNLRSEMAAFLLDHVFSDPEDADLDDTESLEHEEKMKMTLYQNKRNQLAGYCKLVLYGVLDLSAATVVFKHYIKYFKDFGDIIKETVNKSKLISPILSAKTVCLSLQQLFSEMLIEDNNWQDFIEIKHLAKRFAMSFGINLNRVRKPLVALHTDGVQFAFRDMVGEEGQHTNLRFLEILSEFSIKLLHQDRTKLTELLKSVCPHDGLSSSSVRLYLNSLEDRPAAKAREQEEGSDATPSDGTPVAKRKKRTSAKVASKGESWLDSLNSIPSNLPTPALTSTVLKPAKESASRATEPDVSCSSPQADSANEFSEGSIMRKVSSKKRQPASSLAVSSPVASSPAASSLLASSPAASSPAASSLPASSLPASSPAVSIQPASSPTAPTANLKDLNSDFSLLYLFEGDNAEGEERPEIDSDDISEAASSMPSKHAASVLDELFE